MKQKIPTIMKIKTTTILTTKLIMGLQALAI
jgi:hypothetical protein